MTKGVLYYSCLTHDPRIEAAGRAQLRRAAGALPITSVTLGEADFGDTRIVLPLPRSPETMHRQVFVGLDQMTTDVVFLVESDVLYHPDHFVFEPPRDDTFYYNVNVWKVRSPDGHAIRTAECQQVSGCCANRALLLDHYRQRLDRIGRDGFRQRNGYEPGTKLIAKGGYDDVLNNASWHAARPNVDIRHDKTLTLSKWSVDDFRNKKYAAGWEEAAGVPGWGITEGRFWDFIADRS